MKKITLCFLFAFWGLIVNAQEFKWDVNAGCLLSNTKLKADLAMINDFTDFDPVIRSRYLEETNSESGFFYRIGRKITFFRKSGFIRAY
ncbi:hypothetical protein [Leeuwenhoekiella marinoflava]|uniref:hypothetical protein n=1 Tax=Leeuwenhoekiella marinoflava TaxID=988 RepID=UPI0030014A00